MLILLALCCAMVIAAPPQLPSAFNTSFSLVLANSLGQGPSTAFWAYDSVAGGQYVWHPICPLPNYKSGCAITFAGGFSNPVVYTVASLTMTGPAYGCCVLATGVPILPPSSFAKYNFIINTTIYSSQRDSSVFVGLYKSDNRQCFADYAGNLVRILDVDTIWDLPLMSSWNVARQPKSLFEVPKHLCTNAPSC